MDETEPHTGGREAGQRGLAWSQRLVTHQGVATLGQKRRSPNPDNESGRGLRSLRRWNGADRRLQAATQPTDFGDV